MGTGGAERVMSMLANAWVADGHEVTLITLNSTTEDFYSVDPRIRRTRLGLQGTSRSVVHAALRNIGRVFQLRKAIRSTNAEIVLSFITVTNILVVCACVGLGKRVIVSERSDPASTPLPLIWKKLRPWAYRRCRNVVFQTENAARQLVLEIEKTSVNVIHNPISPEYLHPQTMDSAIKSLDRIDWDHTIIAVGRLVQEKGYDLLVTAFSRISKEWPDWHLVILGDGPSRRDLECQIAQLKLASKVYLPGIVSNTAPLLARAQLFVLSSRFEGFPNALLEAMACAVAVVSFDCPSGPADIIRDGENGRLVQNGNIDELARVMSALLASPAERCRLGQAAMQSLSNYNLKEISGQWIQLFRA